MENDTRWVLTKWNIIIGNNRVEIYRSRYHAIPITEMYAWNKSKKVFPRERPHLNSGQIAFWFQKMRNILKLYTNYFPTFLHLTTFDFKFLELEIFQQKVSTKIFVLLQIRSNSDLHTLHKVLRKQKKYSLKRIFEFNYFF